MEPHILFYVILIRELRFVISVLYYSPKYFVKTDGMFTASIRDLYRRQYKKHTMPNRHGVL